jgi:hypothetical protein
VGDAAPDVAAERQGTAIEGTLTLADKTVVRRMTLKEGSVIRLGLLAPPEFI